MQERELSLIRDYETRLLALEEQNAARDLETSTTVSQTIARLSEIMRRVLRAHTGEDVDPDMDPEEAAKLVEQALEREIELARLGKENEELKRMLGILPPLTKEDLQVKEEPKPFYDGGRIQRTASAIPMNEGPFGTYKRARPSA